MAAFILVRLYNAVACTIKGLGSLINDHKLHSKLWCKLRLALSIIARIVNYDFRIVNYDFRIVNYDFRIVNYDSRIVICSFIVLATVSYCHCDLKLRS
jgi:hypothetical protein